MQEEKLIKVRALEPVYYGDRYWRAGDVLTIQEKDFNEKIHELEDPSTPEQITSSGAALAQSRKDTLASRTQPGLETAPDATGAADVLGGDKK